MVIGFETAVVAMRGEIYKWCSGGRDGAVIGGSEPAVGKRLRAASVTERSRDLGTNMLILIAKFSRNEVVFSRRAAVEMRFSDAMRLGIRRP